MNLWEKYVPSLIVYCVLREKCFSYKAIIDFLYKKITQLSHTQFYFEISFKKKRGQGEKNLL